MMLSEEAREFLERNKIRNYNINPDGTVDVDDDVAIFTGQSKLPVKFGKVTGYFTCNNAELTSLEGTPSIVDDYFSCQGNSLTSLECSPSYVGNQFYCDNNLLTSLKGAPSHVSGNFYCSYNQLTSLHDVHKHLKEVNGWFYCKYNHIEDSVLGLLLIDDIRYIELDNIEVQKILNRHINQGRAGVISAQQELLDAGLDEYARL